jgi:hypothetical protein
LGIIFLAAAGTALAAADPSALGAALAAAAGVAGAAVAAAGLDVLVVLPQATSARLATTPSASSLRPWLIASSSRCSDGSGASGP